MSTNKKVEIKINKSGSIIFSKISRGSEEIFKNKLYNTQKIFNDTEDGECIVTLSKSNNEPQHHVLSLEIIIGLRKNEKFPRKTPDSVVDSLISNILYTSAMSAISRLSGICKRNLINNLRVVPVFLDTYEIFPLTIEINDMKKTQSYARFIETIEIKKHMTLYYEQIEQYILSKSKKSREIIPRSLFSVSNAFRISNGYMGSEMIDIGDRLFSDSIICWIWKIKIDSDLDERQCKNFDTSKIVSNYQMMIIGYTFPNQYADSHIYYKFIAKSIFLSEEESDRKISSKGNVSVYDQKRWIYDNFRDTKMASNFSSSSNSSSSSNMTQKNIDNGLMVVAPHINILS